MHAVCFDVPGNTHDKPTSYAEPRHDPHAMPTIAPSAEAGGIRETQFGPYRIVETLGEGGFGVVYLAEQSSPVKRMVALKVLKPGMDSAAVLARFEAERQALALMDHPGIAKVLDAGMTPQGRPYFAMELVRGQAITEYCDLHRLGIPQRLALFNSVCHAVHHAHQKGVIHRDLKPSNILVAVLDGEPVVKVIDFGIAKATGASLNPRVHTMIGQFIGTPEYMSPEQAESAGVDIDTRTDVYSLGVLLYELTTGELPIDAERLRKASSHEIPKLLREIDPPRPSTRLSGSGTAITGSPATAIDDKARRRGTDRASLLRRLRGDLDWITMKAMEKDRTRRYESAAALAADIERHLRDEPVLAGPPSAAYRVSKFVRRHRGGVAASVVLALSIITGLIVSVALYRQASAAREDAKAEATRADAQREQAQIEARKAQAAVEFMAGMFESIDPEQSRGREVTVRQVLDKASTQISTSQDEPLVRAEILEILGGAYHTLGDYEQAIDKLNGALQSRRAAGLTDDVRFFQVQAKLSASLMSAGKLDEAEVALDSAIAGRTKHLGIDHSDTLFSRSLKAMLLQLQGRNGPAEETLREVISAQQRVVGPGASATLESRSQLADLLQEAGKFEEARKEATDIVDLATRNLGPDSTFTLQAQSILGSILYDMGEDAEAERVLRGAMAAKRKVFGEDHPQTLTTGNALLLLLTREKKLDEATELGKQLVDTGVKALGPDHNSTHTYMSNYAAALVQARRFDEAEALYRRVLDSRIQTLGPTSRATLGTKNSLGNLLCDTGRVEEGYKILEEVRQTLDATLPADHWILGLSRSHVGQALLDLKRYDEARAMLTDGYDRLSKALGADHPNTQICAKSLADLAKATGDAEAEASWRAKAAPPATDAGK
ncbi:MAG: hypothetical protein AMXMBFR58_08330 [Phycisphaerae bacterium]